MTQAALKVDPFEIEPLNPRDPNDGIEGETDIPEDRLHAGRFRVLIDRKILLECLNLVAAILALVGLVAVIMVTCLMPDSISSGLDGSLFLGVERSGGKFCHPSDHTCTPVPALQMAKETNYQWIRLQVMVEPNGEYGLFQDLQYTLDTAKEAKRYGLKFLLAFHYSHWWAGPENQWTPTSWLEEEPSSDEESTLSQCQRHIFKHTKEVMQALKDQGTLPDAVQIGNAVTNGIMWGTGRLPDHWEDFVSLIQSGIDAVDEVVEGVNRPKIVIHLDEGGNTDLCETWMSQYLSLGGQVDIVGLSYFPMWHGSIQDLQTNINNLSRTFQLEVWVVETAYYWEGQCDDEDCKKKLPFPLTEDGQYEYLRALGTRLVDQVPCSLLLGLALVSTQIMVRG